MENNELENISEYRVGALNMFPMVFFLLILFPLTLIEAQWSNDPTQNLQVSPFGLNPVACTDGEGGAYVFWTNNPNIWGMKLDRYGYLQWSSYVEIPGPGDRRSSPKLIPDGSGNAIMGYSEVMGVDTASGLIIYKLKVQKIDSLGNLLWGGEGQLVALDTLIHSPSTFKILEDGQGGAHVLWTAAEVDLDSIYIRSLHAQRITPNGQRLWGDEGILIHDPLYPNTNAIAASVEGNGGFIIEYIKDGASEYTFQRFDSNGSILWTTNSIDGYSHMILGPTSDIRLASVKGSGINRKIIANRMSLDGQFLWGADGVTVEDSIGLNSGLSDITIRDDSVLVIYWSKIISWPDNYDSYVQFIDHNGNLLFPGGSRLVSAYMSNKGGLRVLPSDNNSSIYIWFDDRYGGVYNQLFYSQKLDSLGNRLWNNLDILISDLSPEGGYNFISDKHDGFILFWGKLGVSYHGIYAQQVSKNGQLGEVITSIDRSENTIPYQFQLFQNYPNPFNNTTIIPFSIHKTAKVILEIVNILGQNVGTVYGGLLHPGEYQFFWDGFGNDGLPAASGIYFAQLKTENKHAVRKMILIR